MNRLSLDILVALGEARRLVAAAPPDSSEARLAAVVVAELTRLRAKLLPATCWDHDERPEVPTAESAQA